MHATANVAATVELMVAAIPEMRLRELFVRLILDSLPPTPPPPPPAQDAAKSRRGRPPKAAAAANGRRRRTMRRGSAKKIIYPKLQERRRRYESSAAPATPPRPQPPLSTPAATEPARARTHLLSPRKPCGTTPHASSRVPHGAPSPASSVLTSTSLAAPSTPQVFRMGFVP
jgi:hypothetical protein